LAISQADEVERWQIKQMRRDWYMAKVHARKGNTGKMLLIPITCRTTPPIGAKSKSAIKPSKDTASVEAVNLSFPVWNAIRIRWNATKVP